MNFHFIRIHDRRFTVRESKEIIDDDSYRDISTQELSNNQRRCYFWTYSHWAKNCLKKKMNDVRRRRERSTSHVAEWLMYSVIERDAGSNPVRGRIFFSFCRVHNPLNFGKFFLLMIGSILSRSQRRRGLSTTLNPNMQLILPGHLSFKTLPRWYEYLPIFTFITNFLIFKISMLETFVYFRERQNEHHSL